MKMKSNCFCLWPVLAAGLMISPLSAQEPASPGAPPSRDAPRETPHEAPNPERIQAVVREMAQLHQAGKHEEAREISQRLREIAKDNPQVARQVLESLKEQRQQQSKAAKPKTPERPNARWPARMCRRDNHNARWCARIPQGANKWPNSAI